MKVEVLLCILASCFALSQNASLSNPISLTALVESSRFNFFGETYYPFGANLIINGDFQQSPVPSNSKYIPTDIIPTGFGSKSTIVNASLFSKEWNVDTNACRLGKGYLQLPDDSLGLITSLTGITPGVYLLSFRYSFHNIPQQTKSQNKRPSVTVTVESRPIIILNPFNTNIRKVDQLVLIGSNDIVINFVFSESPSSRNSQISLFIDDISFKKCEPKSVVGLNTTQNYIRDGHFKNIYLNVSETTREITNNTDDWKVKGSYYIVRRQFVSLVWGAGMAAQLKANQKQNARVTSQISQKVSIFQEGFYVFGFDYTARIGYSASATMDLLFNSLVIGSFFVQRPVISSEQILLELPIGNTIFTFLSTGFGSNFGMVISSVFLSKILQPKQFTIGSIEVIENGDFSKPALQIDQFFQGPNKTVDGWNFISVFRWRGSFYSPVWEQRSIVCQLIKGQAIKQSFQTFASKNYLLKFEWNARSKFITSASFYVKWNEQIIASLFPTVSSRIYDRFLVRGRDKTNSTLEIGSINSNALESFTTIISRISLKQIYLLKEWNQIEEIKDNLSTGWNCKLNVLCQVLDGPNKGSDYSLARIKGNFIIITESTFASTAYELNSSRTYLLEFLAGQKMDNMKQSQLLVHINGAFADAFLVPKQTIISQLVFTTPANPPKVRVPIEFKTRCRGSCTIIIQNTRIVRLERRPVQNLLID